MSNPYLVHVVGFPDNFPIERKDRLFYWTIFIILFYSTTKLFCWLRKLHGEPVTSFDKSAAYMPCWPIERGFLCKAFQNEHHCTNEMSFYFKDNTLQGLARSTYLLWSRFGICHEVFVNEYLFKNDFFVRRIFRLFRRFKKKNIFQFGRNLSKILLFCPEKMKILTLGTIFLPEGTDFSGRLQALWYYIGLWIRMHRVRILTWVTLSVTRLGDLLHFLASFKSLCSN